jgi:hypothetical protein
MKEQQRKLNEKLRGHDAYYGVTGNFRMLSRLRCEVAAAAQSQRQPNLESVPGQAAGVSPYSRRESFTPASQ